jgi:hypothetical protein
VIVPEGHVGLYHMIIIASRSLVMM